MIKCWSNLDNLLEIDFRLFSSLEDLLTSKNSWSYCGQYDRCDNFGHGIAFPGDCGPSSEQYCQWSRSNHSRPNELTSSHIDDLDECLKGKQDVRYWLYRTPSSGLVAENNTELLTSTRVETTVHSSSKPRPLSHLRSFQPLVPKGDPNISTTDIDILKQMRGITSKVYSTPTNIPRSITMPLQIVPEPERSLQMTNLTNCITNPIAGAVVSSLGSSYDYHGWGNPYNFFDGDMLSQYLSTYFPCAVQIQLPNALLLGGYRVYGDPANDNYSYANPRDWRFEGSNDGTVWTVLDIQVNQQPYGFNDYAFDTQASYSYYRYYVTANNNCYNGQTCAVDYTQYVVNFLELQLCVKEANI